MNRRARLAWLALALAAVPVVLAAIFIWRARSSLF